ncbi:MAG: sulfite exporter TauE/SafE family protein [Acidimicrobiales bacterium]
MIAPLDALGIFAAGLAAGTINTVVGSGSLITFPTLLALGYPPVLANVSNNIGLVPGSISGVVGYRRELRGQRSRIARLSVASLGGGLLGAVLLLVLPDGVFRRIVPVLILLACALVIIQPRLTKRVASDRDDAAPQVGAILLASVFATGVYGGYFGAAQGVILIMLLAIFLDDDLQRLNAAKNVLALLVNGIAGVVFILFTSVDWTIVALIAGGSIIGGQLGATVGRRLPRPALRAAIIVVGLVAAVRLLSN